MAKVQSTAPHARNQKAYANDKKARFKKVRKTKHEHAICHKPPRRQRGFEGKSMVLKRPQHSLTAYNFFFKYTRSKLLSSSVITDNDAMVEFPSPRKFFDTLNLPRKDGTEKKKRLHNKTHGKYSFRDLAKKIAAQWRVLSPEEKTIYLELAKQDKERYYIEKDHFQQMKEDQQMEEEIEMFKEITSVIPCAFGQNSMTNCDPLSTCMLSAPQRCGDPDEIISRERGCAKGSYYESPPQSIIIKKQGNEEIIQKQRQNKGEKEPDWEPLPINEFLHTDLHELQSIYIVLRMD